VAPDRSRNWLVVLEAAVPDVLQLAGGEADVDTEAFEFHVGIVSETHYPLAVLHIFNLRLEPVQRPMVWFARIRVGVRVQARPAAERHAGGVVARDEVGGNESGTLVAEAEVLVAAWVGVAGLVSRVEQVVVLLPIRYGLSEAKSIVDAAEGADEVPPDADFSRVLLVELTVRTPRGGRE